MTAALGLRGRSRLSTPFFSISGILAHAQPAPYGSNPRMSATSGSDWRERRVLRACGAPLVGLVALALCAACGSSSSKTAPRAPEVEVANVVQQDVKLYGEWVATLDGFVNAQIQPQVIGYLIKQDYREGSFVHKGDVLFEIDPRPFQAALDLARAQLAQARGAARQCRRQFADATSPKRRSAQFRAVSSRPTPRRRPQPAPASKPLRPPSSRPSLTSTSPKCAR